MELNVFTHDACLTRAFLALGADAHLPGRDGAEHLRFLASRDGRPLARALLAWPAELRDEDGAPLGAIGFFEAVERAAARDVLQAACGALVARGRRRAWAPLDVDVWHGYRVMTRGFEREPFFAEPRNPPTYPEWLAEAGFAPRHRWHTFELGGDEPLRELQALHAEACAGVAAAGYRCEGLEGLAFETLARRLHPLLVRSFAGFLGATPLPPQAFAEIFAPARSALEPRASVFVRGPAGEDVGFALVFHDAGAPASRERRPSRRLLLHLGGLSVAPEARPRGLARAALWEVLRRLRALRRESVLVTLMAEGSPARRLFGRFGESSAREYALFEWRA